MPEAQENNQQNQGTTPAPPAQGTTPPATPPAETPPAEGATPPAEGGSGASAPTAQESTQQKAAEQARAAEQAASDENKSITQSSKDKLGTYNTSVGGKDNEIYNNIIYQNFQYGNGQRANDGANASEALCSILDNYHWTLDTFANRLRNNETVLKDGSVASLSSPVPHCYLIEYQQKHSSNITNFVNTIVAAGQVLADQKVQSAFKTVGNTISTLQAGLMSVLMGSDGAAPTTPTPPQPTTTGSGQAGAAGSNGAAGGTGGGASGSSGGNGAAGGTSGSSGGASPAPAQQQPSSTPSTFSSIRNSLVDMTNTILQKLPNASELVTNGISGSTYLAPYKLLYSLNDTKQRYVFPMLSNPPINKVINSFDNKQQDDSILSSNNLFTWINGVASGIVTFTRDIKDFAHLLGGEKSISYQLSNVEKAKFFQYPTQTQEYTISFPLLNTVKNEKGKPPHWKTNYKFLLLFTLRNMIFRRDNASFFPPLFYDMVIPGVIRQPFCYVSDINVKPLGIVRMLEIENPLSFIKGKYSVAVPQAWIVTIKLKSLLATSANMVLSGLGELSINATTQS